MHRICRLLACLCASASFASNFEGVWSSDCIKVAGNWSGHITLALRDSVLHSKVTFFSKPNCVGIVRLAYSEVGEVKLSQNSQDIAVDFSPQSVRISYFEVADVEAAMQRRACGYRDWQAGVPNEMLGTKCERDMGFSRTRFHLLGLRDGKLYLGKVQNSTVGQSPATRPTILDLRLALSRIEG